MEQLEKEANDAALKLVSNMLQKSGQLEKLEQYKKRITRKKVASEAMLRTAVQNQLDGIKCGMNHLKVMESDIGQVKINLNSIQELFDVLPPLGIKLQEIRQRNLHHSQYVTAIENLKHLFTVPESIEKAKQWINEGKLLHAHQCVVDLENSRDDLLFELYKMPNQSAADKVLLKTYFQDVEAVSELLRKQLKLVLSRLLNTVRKEPTAVVTVLRIIEREEVSDYHSLQRQKQTGFLPEGRPKKWKDMAFLELENSVSQRIEGTQVDERSSNKMWLVRYLELTKILILEDLRVIKTLCAPCFPPSYNIVDRYVRMYHACLADNLKLIINQGLVGNEYVSMLSWVQNVYFGKELMKHPELDIDISCVGSLLDHEIINDLQRDYLAGIETNYKEWMGKAVKAEKEDWYSQVPPEENADGFFTTESPVIIFQMIHQNLEVANTIGADLTQKALSLSIDQLINFGNLYRDAIVEFKKTHFENRNQIPYFTHHMITIINNCSQFCDLSEETKKLHWKTEAYSSNPVTSSYESLIGAFTALRNECAGYLLEEAFLDLDSHFQDLITTKWTKSSIPLDTICVTLDDYFQDYVRLKANNFEYVMSRAEYLVTKRYISSMLQKKISFKTPEERQQGAAKISREIDQIKEFFGKFASNLGSAREFCPLDAIIVLCEVIKCEDTDILSLDLHSLADKYPDITEDQMSRLLYLRGDLSRADIRDKVSFVKETVKNKKESSAVKVRSIFQDVNVG